MAQASSPSPSTGVHELSQSAEWRKLVHYEADADSPTGWKSAIHGPDFFLHATAGRIDPHAELTATIEAMASSLANDEDPNAHAQCRFPARKAWLSQQLVRTVFSLPPVKCPNWDQWSHHQSIDTVTLVLATGYLGNPASYYGHTLLKFSASSQPSSNSLQDLTVNYGAVLTGEDDPLTYMAKGVFGGYDGGFSDVPYYFHRNQYGEHELRDLWEYELNLSRDDAALVAAHAWEVLGKPYQYFFFRRNCAFRMGELVEILKGVSIIPANRPWTVPQAVLQQAAVAHTPDGQALIRSIRHMPSRQSRFYARYHTLNADEAHVFKHLVRANATMADARFQSLSVESRRAVIDVVLDYHQFTAETDDRASTQLHPQYGLALAERYRLPAGQPRAVARTQTEPPHSSRRPSWIQVGRSSAPASGVIRVRPAYYDPLDSDQGHVPHATLAMGDVHLHVVAGKIKIRQLDLVSIESVSPAITGLQGDRGEAWRLRAGWEPSKPGCTSCLTPRVQGDIGFGKQLQRSTFLSAHMGGAVQGNVKGSGLGFARVSADLIWRPTSAWSTRLSQEYRWPIAADQKPYAIHRAEVRRALSTNLDVRLSHEHSSGVGGASTTHLGLGTYW